MSNIVKLILLSALLFGIVYFSISLRRDKAKKVFNDPVGTVATVVSVKWKTIKIGYTSNGSSYYHVESIPFEGITESEQFVAFTQPGDPENVLVYYDHPVLDSSTFRFRSIVPVSVDFPWFQTDYLKFSYEVNGESFTRGQQYYVTESRPSPEEKLLVWYREDNPEIAYLCKRP